MENIIKQTIGVLQEIYEKNLRNLIGGKSIHSACSELYLDVQKIGLMILKNNLELLDKDIREIDGRVDRYKIDGTTKKKLLCELGEVEFTKTRYHDVKNNEYLYLLDKYLSIESEERMTDGVRERILDEAIDSSYKKGGKRASETIKVSKGTTKNIVDGLKIETIKVTKKCKEKKQVDYVYIDCDEAHINIQNKGGKKKNAISKLLYIYDGKEKDNFSSKRNHLINPYYISGIYGGKAGNLELFNEAYRYIENNYEVNTIKKIYINGDGALWIKEGENIIPNSKFVLDSFHMYESMRKATSHLQDSQDDAIDEMINNIKNNNRDEFDITFNTIESYAKTDKEEKRIYEQWTYLSNNFDSITLRLKGDKSIIGCSAEGHVSHILAERMTSRPMGWSIINADKMSKLRAYKLNGGNIRTLIDNQRNRIDFKLDYGLERIEKPKHCQNRSYYKEEYSECGKYYDIINVELSAQVRKRFCIQGIL